MEEIKAYINTLKNRIDYIQNNLPEFWMHEHLKEIEVLYKVIIELKTIINEDINDMNNVKQWLKSYLRDV